MSETINVPKVGPVKKSYVLGAGGVVGAYVVYRYWSAANTGSSPPAAADYEPDTSSITQAGGAPLASDRTGNTTDTSGTDGQITTNDQWTDRAVEKLTTIGGWESRTVLTALGKFLARQPLTDQEALIVRAATAAAGQPPVGGPYPVVLVSGGHTEPAKASVPPRPSGLFVNTVHDDNVILQWPAVAGATGYDIDVSHKPIKRVGAVTSDRATGLHSQTRYTARVRARNSHGAGPWSSVINFSTGKKGS